LSSIFPEEFDSLRKKLLENYLEKIQFDMRKRYKQIIDNKDILRNFQDERDEDGA
jgi:hypothetical protein